jgi:hypothetical protein
MYIYAGTKVEVRDNGTELLTKEATENGNGITSSITYTDERGGDHTYLLNAVGSATRQVTQNPLGEFESLQLNTAPGQHTLQFRNGNKYVFEEVGASLVNSPGNTARLKCIEDPYGNRLTME